MGKIKLLFLFLIIFNSHQLFSQSFYTYLDVGNVGVKVDSNNWYELLGWNISLPTFFLRRPDLDVGLSIQTAMFESDLNFENIGFSSLTTRLFWTPFLDDDLAIFGPFVAIGFNRFDYVRLVVDVGIKYSWFITILDSKLPSEFVYRPVDIEIGYSLVDKDYYVGLKTDITFGLGMFLDMMNIDIPFPEI